MSTKSNRSAGTQHTQKGVTQGITLVDPKTGNPVNVILGQDGKYRLAVDANVTANISGVEVSLDGVGPGGDNVYLVDNNTGAKFKINPDGSIDVNVELDSTDGDSVAVVGTEDATPSGIQHTLKIGSDGNTRVKDEEANTTLHNLDDKIDVDLSTRATEATLSNINDKLVDGNDIGDVTINNINSNPVPVRVMSKLVPEAHDDIVYTRDPDTFVITQLDYKLGGSTVATVIIQRDAYLNIIRTYRV